VSSTQESETPPPGDGGGARETSAGSGTHPQDTTRSAGGKDGDHLWALVPRQKHRASKVFRWLDSDTLRLEASYDAGFRFHTCRYPRDGALHGIRDLAELLARAESHDVFCIRGKPRESVDTSRPVTRRKGEQYTDDPTEPGPHWREHSEGRRWLMIDLDDLEAPEWLPPEPGEADLRRAVRYATEALPDCFHDISTFYQWSSSAGMTCTEGGDVYRARWSDLRLHLWFWCERRVCGASLREWLREWREETDTPVDPALYHAVQPHFLAVPTFLDGSDPLAGQRSGLLEGASDVVEPPESVVGRSAFVERKKVRERHRRTRSRSVRVKSKAQTEDAKSQYGAAALESACKTVAGAPKGTRETTLRDESYAIGTLVGAGAIDVTRALNALVAAGQSAGLPEREAVDKAARALQAGEGDPRDLSHVGLDDDEDNWGDWTGFGSTGGEGADDEPATGPEDDAYDLTFPPERGNPPDAPTPAELRHWADDTPDRPGVKPLFCEAEVDDVREWLKGQSYDIQEQWLDRAAWLEVCEELPRDEAEREARRRIVEGAEGASRLSEEHRKYIDERLSEIDAAAPWGGEDVSEVDV